MEKRKRFHRLIRIRMKDKGGKHSSNMSGHQVHEPFNFANDAIHSQRSNCFSHKFPMNENSQCGSA